MFKLRGALCPPGSYATVPDNSPGKFILRSLRNFAIVVYKSTNVLISGENCQITL